MTDYFTALQQPRRPWLDLEELKQKYQELTLKEHPDRRRDQAPGLDFAIINEAYCTLTDPKSRLHHLLSLEGHDRLGNQSVPEELVQLFGQIGAFIQNIDGLLEKFRTSQTSLSKSLLQPDILKAQQRATELSDELKKLYSKALDELKRVDAVSGERPREVIEDLKKLYYRFAYLGRWRDQVRERQFQLSV
jgi:curved DNA-binding protein CbpA